MGTVKIVFDFGGVIVFGQIAVVKAAVDITSGAIPIFARLRIG